MESFTIHNQVPLHYELEINLISIRIISQITIKCKPYHKIIILSL